MLIKMHLSHVVYILNMIPAVRVQLLTAGAALEPTDLYCIQNEKSKFSPPAQPRHQREKLSNSVPVP